MEEKKENEILETLLKPFGTVQKFFSDALKSDQKPLGEKMQTKVREKLHPILSPLSSWVADNVVKYFEEHTDKKIIEESNEKGSNHFLVQAQVYVSSLYKNLKAHLKKNAPEKQDRAKPTILCGITNILERGKTATANLFNAHIETKTSSKAKARAA